MSVPFHTQLQPFEENQSPSPIEEVDNPYELSLYHSRSRSPPGKSRSPGPSSPKATVNNLQRQLSGDPENPPPAWQRRPSINTQKSGKSSHSVSGSTRTRRSPSDSSSTPSIPNLPPSSRRHHNLTMTATTRNAAGAGIPSQLFMHESPSGSAVSLVDDPMLTLPQPAFRRRKAGSNRSSISSSQDLSTLTSEELWGMDQEVFADMSNPLTRSAERPLDTVRRMSSRIEHSPYRNGLPQDVIWPTAPPIEELYDPPTKSQSVTSMASLRSPKNGQKTKRMSRSNSRQPSADGPIARQSSQIYTKSTPVSPQDAVLISSNNSSSTSLASHVLGKNKSSLTLNSRPPSVYYSRDFLSALAPREGGYAIAATMGNGLGAVGTMSVDERRRFGIVADERPKSISRAPVSKSAGMGRWSLDGGEHYGRPYGNPSNNATATSFGRAASGSDPSPSTEDEAARASYLPEGAASPAGISPPASLDSASPPPVQASAPITPSPLSRETAAVDLPSQSAEPPLAQIASATSASAAVVSPGPTEVAPLPIPVVPQTASPLKTKMSKKELKAAAKEAKAAEKAAAAKLNAHRAEQAKQALIKKEMDKMAMKAAVKKKKEDDKRKETEEKERKKTEKKAASKAKAAPASAPKPSRSNLATPATSTAVGTPVQTTSAPPVPPIPASVSQKAPVNGQSTSARPARPFPRAQSEHQDPSTASEKPRQNTTSMPLNATAAQPATVASQQGSVRSNAKPRLGMFGTIKKRLSIFGNDLKSPQDSPRQIQRAPPVSNTLTETPADAFSTPLVARPTPAAQPQQSIALPPAADSARVVTPTVAPPVMMTTPEPLNDLPPRSSSHGTPTSHAGLQMTSPQSMHSALMTSPRNQDNVSQLPQETQSSPLSRRLSHEGRGGESPSSMRRGSSLHGPRPMPRPSHSPDPARPQSITSSIPDQPFVPEATTPSASGDSAEGNSSMFSPSFGKSSQATDLASPFTSEAGEVNEKGGEMEETLPLRENSAETVHPAELQTISAH